MPAPGVTADCMTEAGEVLSHHTITYARPARSEAADEPVAESGISNREGSRR